MHLVARGVDVCRASHQAGEMRPEIPAILLKETADKREFVTNMPATDAIEHTQKVIRLAAESRL